MIFAEDIESAVTRRECEALARYAEGARVLEVGSWYGRSTIALASSADRVYAVDWHYGDAHAGQRDTLQGFLANLERYGVRGKVIPVVGVVEDVAPLFASRVFDVVFLDAFHEEETVFQHLCLLEGLIQYRLLVHDYEQVMFGAGIQRAIERWRVVAGHWDLEEVVDSMAVLRR